MEAPAVRVAKTMNTLHGDAITVSSALLRAEQRSGCQKEGIHAPEHLFAGFMRNYLNGVEIIDISPMVAAPVFI